LFAVAVAAVVAFAAGLIVGAGSGEAPSERVASRFTTAWENGDWARMWALSAGPNRPRASTFTARYRAAADTATVSAIAFGRPRDERDGVVEIPAVVTTRVWGRLPATLRLPVAGEGDAARVRWSSRLVFPGLRPGERLRRETTLPARADLRFRDNTKMSRFPELSASIAGDLGSIPADRAARMRALGVPADGLVGLSGLQRVFDERLLGRPGGVLYAGRRVLARAVSVPARDVRTTISPKVQRAAVDALAGRLGGAIALRPGSGEVLGAAGVAWSALQPPGSTFKIVTLAGVLQAGVAKAASAFPVATDATLSGVKLENANGESCGGTLLESFAESCNSVFAPLGAKLGARRLVATARRFGFGEAPPIAGAATPSLPPAEQIGDDLAVGSTAIGQGRVEATALQMAIVAATIADGGRRPRPTLQLGARLPPVRAVSPRVARTVARMMRGVVRFGTGTAAALPGVTVAGKTGTAELESTVKAAGDQAPEAGATTQDQTKDTDAWFAAFAPSGSRKTARAAVGVLLVRAGAGGDTAAPAARGLLQAALR
jgi:cell division protein FtsI/penicillin-binding protein 2